MCLEPFVQYRGDSHLVYYQSPYNRGFRNKEKQRAIMKKARKTAYTGEMTDGAERRMKKSISLLVQASKPKWINNPVTNKMFLHTVSFCTLTIGSDDDPIITMAKAKLLLTDFTDWLYHTKNVRLRVWKGELQKRGQPHFHLIFPEFIHLAEIRAKWNNIQRKHGTIDGYAAKHKHFRPPSTEIKKARDRGDITNYLCKEMSKETAAAKLDYWKQINDEIEQGMHPDIEQLQGRDRKKAIKAIINERYAAEYGDNVEPGKIWDCSEVLSQTGYYTLALSNRQQAYFEAAEKNGLCSINADPDGWWAVIKWTDRPPPGFFTDKQKDEYDSFLKMISDKANNVYVEPEEKPVPIPVIVREVEPVPVIQGWRPLEIDFSFN